MFRSTLSHGTPDVNGKNCGLPGNEWGVDPAGWMGGLPANPPMGWGGGLHAFEKLMVGGLAMTPPTQT